MDVTAFHQKLLGRAPQPEQSQFYESGCLGFDSSDRTDKTKLIAVLTKALSMTPSGQTIIIVPSALARDEILTPIADVSRGLIRLRKSNKEGILAIKKALTRLGVVDGVLRMNEPPRWVAFGFSTEMEHLPAWLTTRLLTTSKTPGNF